jgi:nicotinamidase-related amidase/alkylated DNA repair dioxygenase AlkB
MNAFSFLSSLPNAPSLQTRKALLLLDFQNDFVRPNGRLPVRKAVDILETLPGLVQSFRRTGEVVWVRTQYEGPRPVIDPDYGGERIILDAGSLDKKGGRRRSDGDEADDEVDPEAFLSGPQPACLPQTYGVQFPAPILAAIDHEHDFVIEKSDYSALQSPGMVLSLRSRLVTELYICGSLSNVSVYATALDAAQQGFAITLIEDCMGYRSFARHEQAIRRLADIVGANGISVQELMDDGDWEETQEIARASSPEPPPDIGSTTIEGVLDHLVVKNSPPAKRSSITGKADTPSPNTAAHMGGEIEADDNPYDDDDDDELVLPPTKYPRASASRVRETRNLVANSARLRRNKSGISPSRRPASESVSPAAVPKTLPVSPARPNYAKKNPYLGADDTIAEGDSRIVYNLDLPADAFARIHDEVNWQKMYHMSGQVPRLVAVQGAVSDGSYPIYRHPADESPVLEPFTETVNTARTRAEKIVGHPLNHVLIQMYRDGQDNISEHSDKTLDIVRGSSIVNVSLGAQRTMTLRTKKRPAPDGQDANDDRQKQQVLMPHGSMFILGPLSNMRWLHGIRPDKRPDTEKSAEEKAYHGERISLTFRNIGTFIDPDSGTIYGQGAVSKQPESAGKVVHGDAAELIRAFGAENRETEFDWDGVYGGGFDVVNFVQPTVAHISLCGDAVADIRVRLCLAENGMRYEAVYQDTASKRHLTTYTSPDTKTVVSGDIPILLHLASLDSSSARGTNVICGGTCLAEISKLDKAFRTQDFGLLSAWNDRLAEHGHHFVSGPTITIDDIALWPILYEIERQKGILSTYPFLAAYYQRIERRGCVRVVMDEIRHGIDLEGRRT